MVVLGREGVLRVGFQLYCVRDGDGAAGGNVLGTMEDPVASGVKEEPVLSLISSRLKSGKRKYTQILEKERDMNSKKGKTLNRDEEELIRSKPCVLAIIKELEMLHQSISVALKEELDVFRQGFATATVNKEYEADKVQALETTEDPSNRSGGSDVHEHRKALGDKKNKRSASSHELSAKVRINETTIYGSPSNSKDEIKAFRGTLHGRSVIARHYEKQVELSQENIIPHSLFYVGKKKLTHFHIFEYYLCTLRDLKDKDLKGKDILCDSDVLDMLKSVHLVTAPVINKLRWLFELWDKGLTHRNLTADNIVVTMEGKGQFRSKLTGMVKNQNSAEDDCTCLVQIIEHCLKDNNGVVKSEEGIDFLYGRFHWSLVSFGNHLDPRVLLRHPLFWEPSKCLDFINPTVEMINAANCSKSFSKTANDFLAELEKFNACEWDKKMPDKSVLKPTKPLQASKVYNYTLTQDLLRFMRNTNAHYLSNSCTAVCSYISINY
ncbi:KEN domain [Macleaya cordata]|uniref:KEN domain n=1 Tax=Macleaya cordata TaxID=56857 RepID=A0A200Q1D0_MACCD|nr:KEN domain [Macleaya cordata]